MFLLLLLLLSVTLTPVEPLLGGHLDEAEAGSGCEDAANYFDSIGVDDEDYVSEEEGSTDLLESLIRGPPVFTDSEEDHVSDGPSPDLLHDKTRDEGERQVHQDSTRPSPPQSSGKIIPETLVIKNRTHAKLNGNLIITNSGDQEEPRLFFEEEQKHSQEEPEVKKILIESLGNKGSKMSISVLSIIIIMLL